MGLLTKCFEDLHATDPETYAFLNQFDVTEPASYKAAMSGENCSEWAKAMIEEWESLLENNTW